MDALPATDSAELAEINLAEEFGLSPKDAAAELLRRRRMRESIIGYSENIKIPLVPEDPDANELELLTLPVGVNMPLHHKYLYSKIQEVMLMRYGRMMIFMAPGGAKSTIATVVSPTWYMGKFPGSQIILASYNSELAKKHGSRGRHIVQQESFSSAFDATISTDTTSKELWTLTNGSEYRSAGILSGITGNRANGVLIDDPIRGRKDAESPAIRKSTLDAYNDDIMTRLIPGAWIILIQTRWHYQDLAGSILPDDYDGESGPIRCKDGMTWYVVNLVAKVTTAKQEQYDPLGRPRGPVNPADNPPWEEAKKFYLWPEWFDELHWRQYEPRPDDPWGPSERRWASLYQQQPKPDSDQIWLDEWVKEYELGKHPDYLMLFTASDYGVTEPEDDTHDPDWTEHGIGGLDENGDLWIIDWWYGRDTTDVTTRELIKMAKKHKCRRGFGESGIIRRAIEPIMRAEQRRAKWHLNITYLSHIGDKRAKFQSFRSMGSSGRVHIPKCPWGERLRERLINHLIRGHDDAGDTCSLWGRGLDNMPWSRAKATKMRESGVKFGTVAWLEMGTENAEEIGLDKLFSG